MRPEITVDKKNRVSNRIRKIGYIICCILLLLITVQFPIYNWVHSDIIGRGITSIRGNSMAPTIMNNDIVYVNTPTLQRGEIIVAKADEPTEFPMARNVALLKRIVGLPGETIKITNEGVLVNGKLLQEDYCEDVKSTLTTETKYKEILLSDNEYYVLGDNRKESIDSRQMGQIKSYNILYAVTTDPNQYSKSIIYKLIIEEFLIVCVVVIGSIASYYFFFHKTSSDKKSHKSQVQSKNQKRY